jgi:hypothetical protein
MSALVRLVRAIWSLRYVVEVFIIVRMHRAVALVWELTLLLLRAVLSVSSVPFGAEAFSAVSITHVVRDNA